MGKEIHVVLLRCVLFALVKDVVGGVCVCVCVWVVIVFNVWGKGKKGAERQAVFMLEAHAQKKESKWEKKIKKKKNATNGRDGLDGWLGLGHCC